MKLFTTIYEEVGGGSLFIWAQSLNGPNWGYFPSSFLTGTGHPNP